MKKRRLWLFEKSTKRNFADDMRTLLIARQKFKFFLLSGKQFDDELRKANQLEF